MQGLQGTVKSNLECLEESLLPRCLVKDLWRSFGNHPCTEQYHSAPILPSEAYVAMEPAYILARLRMAAHAVHYPVNDISHRGAFSFKGLLPGLLPGSYLEIPVHVFIPYSGWREFDVDDNYEATPLHALDHFLQSKCSLLSSQNILLQAQRLLQCSQRDSVSDSVSESVSDSVSVRFGDRLFTFYDNGIHFSSVETNLTTGEGQFQSGPTGKAGAGTGQWRANLTIRFNGKGQLDVKQAPSSRRTKDGKLILWKGAFVVQGMNDPVEVDPFQNDLQTMEAERKHDMTAVDTKASVSAQSYYRAKKEGLRPCVIALGLDVKKDLIAPNAAFLHNEGVLNKFRTSGATILSITELKLVKCAHNNCDRCGLFVREETQDVFGSFRGLCGAFCPSLLFVPLE